ncbi:MAG: cell division protein FtsZ [Patescibacteria group bacterium]|jgi:cell division protein FtsZ|nr:cell division protein FtsZ [Patescibacteria group bacterium]
MTTKKKNKKIKKQQKKLIKTQKKTKRIKARKKADLKKKRATKQTLETSVILPKIAVKNLRKNKAKSSKENHLIELGNFPVIKVIGIGGAGGNILSRMKQAKIQGVEFIAVNTDLQDLYKCGIRRRIHIGKNISKGMGTGMNPEIGRQAAEESRPQIEEALKGADLVFLTCGLGGGTGSGATPVIADVCQQLGVLTVAVMTKPFSFEGSKRSQIAEEALLKIKDKVDSYIVIPNDRIFNIIDNSTPLYKAFELIDDILRQSVKGISDLINMPGIINVDFSDIKTILSNAGMTLIGLGKASGAERAVNAAKNALNSPLFEYSPHMAKGVLFNIMGDSSLTMTEINEAARLITEIVDPSAKIIFGAMEDPKIKKGEIKIMIIAAGFDNSSKYQSYTANQQRTISKSNIETITTEIKEEKELIPTDSLEEIPAFLRKKKK